MAYLGDNGLSKLWVRMKAYINNRIANLEQGLTMELLWENASPTSAFAAQTLNYGCGTGEKLLIKCSVSKTNSSAAEYKNTFFVLIDTTTNAIMSPPVHFNLTSALAVMHRFITVTSSKIQFAGGGYKATNSTAVKVDSNDYLIPLEIYRIKGVQ